MVNTSSCRDNSLFWDFYIVCGSSIVLYVFLLLWLLFQQLLVIQQIDSWLLSIFCIYKRLNQWFHDDLYKPTIPYLVYEWSTIHWFFNEKTSLISWISENKIRSVYSKGSSSISLTSLFDWTIPISLPIFRSRKMDSWISFSIFYYFFYEDNRNILYFILLYTFNSFTILLKWCNWKIELTNELNKHKFNYFYILIMWDTFPTDGFLIEVALY